MVHGNSHLRLLTTRHNVIMSSELSSCAIIARVRKSCKALCMEVPREGSGKLTPKIQPYKALPNEKLISWD